MLKPSVGHSFPHKDPSQPAPVAKPPSSAYSHSRWEYQVVETVVSVQKEGTIAILGGSDNGEFPYLGDVSTSVQYQNGAAKLVPGSIVLEVQGQKVVGYTQKDVTAWVNNCTRNGNPCVIKTLPPGSLTRDLRHYLSTRFPKGGVDHELQNAIRDNVYLRTVPVTTRPPRPGEVNGVDYTFLSNEEFQALQRSGSLLEAGNFEGNHYGTPKPPPQGGESGRGGGSTLLSGAHPSSEGKRRRNRSNVEAMAASAVESGRPHAEHLAVSAPYQPPPHDADRDGPSLPEGELGPLPPNWEKAYTEGGEPYFIDHVAGTSSWLDPRLARVQKRSAAECGEDELPFGWERIDDPQYGIYFIDHVNRQTQYENPVLMAKRQVPGSQQQVSLDESMASTFPRPKKSPPVGDSMPPPAVSPKENGHSAFHAPPPNNSYGGINTPNSAFTRDPAELRGDFLRTALVKSTRGLGFTIVGGDDHHDEFLQIKSVVPNGPAWQDGKLNTGDVLVYVNDTCVLGYTHSDVVTMFQSIEAGRTVFLEVCRGYPLPFDPNDPNTEIVTTVAVNADSRTSNRPFETEASVRRSRNNSSESMNTAKSMPDLTNTERVHVAPRPGSADLLSVENAGGGNPGGAEDNMASQPAEFLTVGIVKGAAGFGFTIADSAFGQRVKKVLDRARCRGLAEGDLLVDVNSVNVKGMTHSQVVQVLKECPTNQEAAVMVQRGGVAASPPNRKQRKDLSSAAATVNALMPTKKPPPSGGGPNHSGFYRSKTPTADMYSSQPKEVIPNRPKTPLVDTRSRAKTPNSVGDGGGGPPFPGAFSYTDDPKVAALSAQFSHADVNGVDPHSGPQQRDMYPPTNGYSYYDYGHKANHSDPYPQSNPADPYMQGNQSDPYLQHHQMDQYQPHPTDSYPQYPAYYGGGGGYGYAPYPKEGYDVPRGDSGYSSQGHGSAPSRNPYPQYYGNNYPDGSYYPPSEPQSTIRKESTSFELEHPAPINMNRVPSMGVPGVAPRPMAGVALPECHEFTVTLRRHDSGFGFRIVGGTEEGSQVSIGHIVQGGAADMDGSVMTGDEMVRVEGESVVGASHQRVVQLMAAAGANGRVTLMLLRRVPNTQPHVNPNVHAGADIHNRSMEMHQYPYDVAVTRRENEGFGFVIISSVAKSGSTIGRIIEGSPAERCSKLHVGDRILRVNGVDIKCLHHGSIVNLIKESGYAVTLTIGAPKDDASSTTSNSQMADSDIGDDGIGELHLVELRRSARGFGFSIRGGREFHNMPLFVLRIADKGPAADGAKLKVGDQLMEINSVSTKSMTHAEAIELIKQCGTTVTLLIRRGGKLPTHLDPLSPPPPSTLGSPVGPPPPGTHIRSTATLPTGSPQHGFPGSYSVPQSAYPPSSGAPFPPSSRTQPLHSSPAMQYAANGPLGQSSPRGLVAHDAYYWNRPG